MTSKVRLFGKASQQSLKQTIQLKSDLQFKDFLLYLTDSKFNLIWKKTHHSSHNNAFQRPKKQILEKTNIIEN
jgi:hypothetical protein